MNLQERKETDQAIDLEVAAKIGTTAAAEEEGSLSTMAVTLHHRLQVRLLGVHLLLLGRSLQRAGKKWPSD